MPPASPVRIRCFQAAQRQLTHCSHPLPGTPSKAPAPYVIPITARAGPAHAAPDPASAQPGIALPPLPAPGDALPGHAVAWAAGGLDGGACGAAGPGPALQGFRKPLIMLPDAESDPDAGSMAGTADAPASGSERGADSGSSSGALRMQRLHPRSHAALCATQALRGAAPVDLS